MLKKYLYENEIVNGDSNDFYCYRSDKIASEEGKEEIHSIKDNEN